MPQNYDYDIIQIGYGPVSKVAALLFARQGWKVGIFERHHEVYPLPRAVCIDHEVYRMLAAIGLGDLTRKVTEPAPIYRWFNSEWKELLAIDWTGASVSGTEGVKFVHQPSFERALDVEVKKTSGIDLHMRAEAIGLEQDGDSVTVAIRDSQSGELRRYRSRYLLGIDGANSFVRESLGISRTDKGFEADWLVVDFALNDGLTARDLGLIECGQYCNPKRPTTIVPGGHDDEGRVCRRWEFMRLPHETREEMNDRAKVEELLGNWIKPEQGELVRHAVYTFRSLVADEWRRGRVLLAGDAAHLMPPFMGQGMCAGMRDIWNLAWKLDPVLRGTADDTILDTYQLERRPHVSDVIDASIFLGSIICIPDEAAAAQRDEMFLSGNAPPPADFPSLVGGMLDKAADGSLKAPAGELAPHGVVRHRGRTGRLDALVPDGFMLVIDDTIDPKAFSAATWDVLGALGVNVVNVAAKTAASDEHYADVQGQLLPWMRARNVAAMLVRPDFYVFGGAGDKSRLEEVVAELGRQARELGLLREGAPKKAAAQ